MSRWTGLGDAARGADYTARFERLAARGQDVHGEAAFCAARLRPGARVLDAGCGTGRVAVRLARLGHECTGVDSDPAMLAEARRLAPDLTWILADLATWSAGDQPFDLVVAAGNVIPLLGAGTEAAAVATLAGALADGGLLVAGFGLDPAHLPLDEAPVTLADYDAWCAAAGLRLRERFASWDGDPYDGAGYAVSVHGRHRPGGDSRNTA